MHLKPLPRVLVERRTPRHFSDPPPPDGVLQMILHAGLQAHQAYRVKPARFIVVRDSRKRARLRRAAMNQPCLGEAPVVIVAFGHPDQWREILEDTGGPDPLPDTLTSRRLEPQRQRVAEYVEQTPLRVWLHRHVMMSFTCMMLTAEALGWDTNLVERFDPAAVSAVLGLPADAEVVAMLAIGRAASADVPGAAPDSFSHLVYNERYGEPWTG
jgi:nitroreductase